MENEQDLSVNGKKEPVSEPDAPDCARIVRESAGMILPAGSPLVQFEIASTGVHPRETPVVIWVVRNPWETQAKDCHCGGTTFAIHKPSLPTKLKPFAKHSVTTVCTCMGSFIE